MTLVLTGIMEMMLLPYVGWGVYNLRRRYRFSDDIPPGVEAATLACVALYVYAQIMALDYLLAEAPVYLIFAALGLFVSATALYGHMAVSLLTWIIVDFMLPAPHENADHPRMGPQEALERKNDYEGALDGYFVLARIYPRDVEVPVRIANCLLRLDRAEEAPAWFERALENCSDGAEALSVANRWCEVCERTLNAPSCAREVLERFLKRFPDAPEASEIREHLARIGHERHEVADDALVPLSEGGPISEQEEDDPQPVRKEELPGLARIEAPLTEPGADTPPPRKRKQGRPVDLEIEAMGPREIDDSLS